jgi:hypothetical protein
MGKALLNQFLIHNDLRPIAQRIYRASRPVQSGDPDASILRPVKSRSFLFNLFLSNSIAKNPFSGRKKCWKAICLNTLPPSYACALIHRFMSSVFYNVIICNNAANCMAFIFWSFNILLPT